MIINVSEKYLFDTVIVHDIDERNQNSFLTHRKGRITYRPKYSLKRKTNNHLSVNDLSKSSRQFSKDIPKISFRPKVSNTATCSIEAARKLLYYDLKWKIFRG